MNKSTNLVAAALAVAVIWLAGGCASTPQTEDLLSAAGFKIVPASTPAQEAQLQKLPNHKISLVQKDGKEYFVYPDAKQNVLYIGQNAQYDRYQKLREQHQLAQDRMETSLMNSDPGWDVWGPWPDAAMLP
jgi:hypothetical protein